MQQIIIRWGDLGLPVQPGIHRFGPHVVEVHLRGTAAKDADVRLLTVFKGLRRLDISLTEVTDAGLKAVGNLKALRELDLGNTSITDAGLKDLKELK